MQGKTTQSGFWLFLALSLVLMGCEQTTLTGSSFSITGSVPGAHPSTSPSGGPATKKLELNEISPSPRPSSDYHSGGSGNGQNSSCKSYPFVPDTVDSPALVFKWDYPVNSANLKAIGVFGIMENGGGFEEVATETELHLTKSHDPVYALAEGMVVYIQPISGIASDAGETEGVFVRYGRNFLIKYVHVRNPVVQLGQQLKTGDLIGSTIVVSPNTPSEYGFYEVETRIKESEGVYAYPMYNFLDASSKSLFDSWWADAKITRDASAKNPFKAKDKEDLTEQSDPCLFQ